MGPSSFDLLSRHSFPQPYELSLFPTRDTLTTSWGDIFIDMQNRNSPILTLQKGTSYQLVHPSLIFINGE